LALSALVAFASAVNVPFTTCGTGDFVASSVDVSPFPPQRGQSVKITTQGHLASVVSGGNFEVDVSLAGITILKQTGDMCKFSPDITCPSGTGDKTVGYTMDVPAIAPAGTYDIVFHGTQQDGKVLFCIQSQFEIKSFWDQVEALPANVIEPMTTVPFETCEASMTFAVSSIDVTPFPPVRGKTVQIVATGTLAEQITAGNFEVDVSLGGITVLKQTGDLCKLSSGASCPTAAGPLSVTYDMAVPLLSPDGTYTIKFRGTQQTGKTVLCITASFELKSSFSFIQPAVKAIAPLVALTSVPFTSCADGEFTTSGLDVTPWPPARGKSAIITAKGNLKSQITSGTYEIDVTFDGLSVLKSTGDICKFAPEVTCPTAPGALTLSHSLAVPLLAPSGTYAITAKGLQQDGKTVFCLNSSFKL